MVYEESRSLKDPEADLGSQTPGLLSLETLGVRQNNRLSPHYL